MPVLGLTGGIATGKSTCARALCAELPAILFDADATAHELLEGDPAVQRAIAEALGPDALDAAGRPDRQRLREVVFAEPESRRRLEAILHPAIRARWLAQAGEYRARPEWLLVDIPLLYETGAQSEFDRIAVVACSPATQRARLREQRKLDDALLERIIGAQLDLSLKVASATYVVWNDATPACLERQVRLLATLLRHLYV